jgi:hypothetical protein
MKRLCDEARRINAINKYEENPSFCQFCGEKIQINEKRFPSDAKRMKFCSRSCSAKKNNSKYPKRERDEFKTVCVVCGKNKSYGAKKCQSCKRKQSLDRVWKCKISKYYMNGASRTKYSSISKWANVYMNDFDSRDKKCQVCGYNKIVQVAHKKPISDFSPDDLMGDVNSSSNLMWLCPNHHAEFDKGLLDL